MGDTQYYCATLGVFKVSVFCVYHKRSEFIWNLWMKCKTAWSVRTLFCIVILLFCISQYKLVFLLYSHTQSHSQAHVHTLSIYRVSHNSWDSEYCPRVTSFSLASQSPAWCDQTVIYTALFDGVSTPAAIPPTASECVWRKCAIVFHLCCQSILYCDDCQMST